LKIKKKKKEYNGSIYKTYKTLSDKELQETNAGMSWWQAIDGVISNFQSTPAWVQGKKQTSGYVPYVPGGGSWVGGPGMKPGR
jgi:hypothetical protein